MCRRSYYYLDYKQFLDVVKWRMMAMRRHIDTRLRRGLDNKGYLCPRCRKSFSALEVSHLLDFSRNVFVCDVPGCGTELIDNEEAEDVRQSKDTLTRFNEQLSVVQQALRSIEGVALPPLDVRAWLAKHAADQPWATELPKEEQGAKPAAPQPPAAPEARLRVEVAGAEAGAELESAARSREEEQRAQNMLPAWHVASTVSGEATGLAVGEGAQEGGEAGVAAEGPVAEADEDCRCAWAVAWLTSRLCPVRVAAAGGGGARGGRGGQAHPVGRRGGGRRRRARRQAAADGAHGRGRRRWRRRRGGAHGGDGGRHLASPAQRAATSGRLELIASCTSQPIYKQRPTQWC